MYLGAFAALGVSNVEMAADLSELTESDQECTHAIGVMKRAQAGDRVYPALEALREMRRRVELPALDVDDHEPGITHERVMRRP